MMKRFTTYLRLLTLSAIASLAFAQPARACVDYHTTVFITCHYDTVNFTDISLTVSNLRIFGGQPNDFCSCGITSYTDIFTNVHYVAFVDSGTTNPVAGFDVWNGNTNASNAWEAVLATGDWSGFVSGVNQNGLTPTAPVELIIRASLPPGYTYTLLDSNIYSIQMGTDQWDPTNQVLANTHQSITGFWTGGAPTLIAEHNSTYFDNLDQSIITALRDREQPAYLEVGPVPATDHLYVRLGNPALTLESVKVFNASGQVVSEVPVSAFRSGRAELDLSAYPQGIYFLRLNTSAGVQTKKFSVMN